MLKQLHVGMTDIASGADQHAKATLHTEAAAISRDLLKKLYADRF